MSDRTHDGRPLWLLSLVDEHTRECVPVDVARRLRSDDTLERVSWLVATNGVLDHIRSDNGPEFTAGAVRDWLKHVGVKTLLIEPGSPWENGCVESFNGKLRDELLDGEIFCTLRGRKSWSRDGVGTTVSCLSRRGKDCDMVRSHGLTRGLSRARLRDSTINDMNTSDTAQRSAAAVVFDLDGTLADTLNDVTKSLNHALRKIGSPTHTRDKVAGMIGDGVSKLLERALGTDDQATGRRALSYFAAHYRQHALASTRLYDGIAEQLDLLVREGWRMAVVSNKAHEFTVQICEGLLSQWSFVTVRGMVEGTPAKPDPTSTLAIGAKLGMHPSRIFFVGDSPMDVVTARSAGMISVGAAWGYRGAGLLEAEKPDLLVLRPHDLAECLFNHHRARSEAG